MTDTYEHLENAPITEALIDIRVKLPVNTDIDKLDAMKDLVAGQYPNRKVRRKVETRVELKEGETPSHSAVEKRDGFLFTTGDGKQVVQARLDGFTFSRLKPYETWERLRDEAYRLWQLYTQIACPESITRVALRYINNLSIPLPIRDFSDYFTAPPIVPEKLPQGVSGFLSRVVIHETALGASAIITQALEAMTGPDFVPIILDIDVFKEADSMEDKFAWDTLEELRHFKNKIFFESITEKSKGLFR